MDLSVAKGESAPGRADLPLVVDLDGTLTSSDLLAEGLVRAVADRPWRLVGMAGRLAAGRAALKSRLAGMVDASDLRVPLRPEVMAFLAAERERGRRIYLATASDRTWAEAIAAEAGVFDGIFASDGETNLKGTAKADLLVAAFGAGGFDYVGDAAADLPVFAMARRAYAVDLPKGADRSLRRLRPDRDILVRRTGRIGPLLAAMRPHQWAKNLLVFLPALAAHRFDPAALAPLAAAFLAFSLVASAVYLVNDLTDLAADRAHPRKCRRPLASGALPPAVGMAAAPLLFVSGLAVALAVSPALVGVLGVYLAATFAYSMRLKRMPIVDVAALAGLYTIRVVAGGVAAGVALSPWMLGFSAFIFLSLALIKRLTELEDHRRSGRGDPGGRGYRLEDIPVLLALAGAAGYAAVVVLALYIESPDMHRLYANPWGLWSAAALLMFWVSRALLIAQRGEMHDDPIVFAFRDGTSRVTGLLAAIAVLAGGL